MQSLARYPSQPGAGGSLAFADPDAELAFAYITNTMQFDPAGDHRSASLISAIYDSLKNQASGR